MLKENAERATLKSLVIASVLSLGVFVPVQAEDASGIGSDARCYRPNAVRVSCGNIATPRFEGTIKNASVVTLPKRIESGENSSAHAGYCERLPDYCRASDWNY